MREVAGFEAQTSPLHYDFFGFIPLKLKNEEAALVMGAHTDKKVILVYSFKLGAIVEGLEIKLNEKRKQCALATVEGRDSTSIIFSGGVGN